MNYQQYLDAVANYNIEIHDVPEEFRTEELYQIAIEKDLCNLDNTPIKFRTENICELAIKRLGGWQIYYVPLNLITEKLCKTAIETDSNGNVLLYIPLQFRTKEICEFAVSIYGANLLSVPKELRTEDICNLAIKTWPDAERFAPKGTSVYNNYIMKKALL